MSAPSSYVALFGLSACCAAYSPPLSPVLAVSSKSQPGFPTRAHSPISPL